MRNSIKTLLPTALLGSLALGCTSEPQKSSTEDMNILFVIVEDWNANAIGTYGNPIVITPNIDELASRGVQFNRAYCQGVVCNPSRASLMTGLRPDATGVYGNPDHFDDHVTADFPFIAGVLKQKGAFTAQTGKLLHKWRYSYNVINQFDQIEMEKPFLDENGIVIDQEPDRGPFTGIQKYKTIIPDLLPPTSNRDWVWVPDQEHDTVLVRLQQERDLRLASGEPDNWPLRRPFQQYHAEMIGDMGFEDKYSEDGLVTLLADKMIDDFGTEGKQFFLSVGLYAPHTPILAPKEFVELYDTAHIEISPITRDKDQGVPDIAVRFGNNYDIFNGMYTQFSPTPERQKLAIAAYYATSSYIDAQIGKLMEALKRNNLAENTIVILTSDHGFHLGEHGCWSKFTVFEESIRVPLIVYVPGASSNGKVSNQIVELVDLLPTMSDMWGIEKDERFEGISFMPLLENPELEWKKAAFCMAPRPLNGRTVRTQRYRYAEFLTSTEFPSPDPPVAIELYDHHTDPNEQINLAGKPEFSEIEKEMKTLLYDGWKSALPLGYN
jgi:arylsulfatase A-like enzyme